MCSSPPVRGNIHAPAFRKLTREGWPGMRQILHEFLDGSKPPSG